MGIAVEYFYTSCRLYIGELRHEAAPFLEHLVISGYRSNMGGTMDNSHVKFSSGSAIFKYSRDYAQALFSNYKVSEVPSSRMEIETNLPTWAIPMFIYDKIGKVCAFGPWIIYIFTIDIYDNISIMFN